MIRASVDRWFDRFRRTGDPRALAKVFDRTAPELWKVAAHLCRDRHAAEDAVQGTFLAAIEDQAAWDLQRPLLPWLLGMLANRVRENRRRTARVPDAARVVAAGERDPADLAAHGEFGAAFRAALQRVAEPYRSALEQHLVFGKAAHEIAAECGVPAGTVRMRLHRGLEQLRQKLPQGFVTGGAVALWLPPESFAAMREVVLAKVPGGALVAAGSGHVVLGVLGVLLMKKTMLAMVASVLVALSCWTWWPGLGDAAAVDPTQVATVVSAKVRPLAADVAPADQDVVDPAVQRVAAAPAAKPAATGRLRLVLRHGGNSRPLAGVSLQVVAGLPGPSAPRDGRLPPGYPAVAGKFDHGTTDAQGAATFTLPPGFAEITPDSLQLAQPIGAEVAAGSETEVVVDVPVRLSPDVEVVDAAGRPVAEARIVGQTSLDRGALVERELGRTGVDGHWRDTFVEPSVSVRAVKDGHAASPPFQLWQAVQKARLRLGGEPATICGTVVGPGGTALAVAGVVIQSHAEGSIGERPIAVRVDEHGRYECAHVPAGKCTVFAWREVEGSSRRLVRRDVDAVALARTVVDLQFQRGARIDVTARDAAGSLLTNVSVGAVWLPETPLWLRLSSEAAAMTMTGRDGRGSIEALMPGRYELQMRWKDLAKSQAVDLVEGQELRVDAVFDASAWLEVQVSDEANTPLAGWEVDAQVCDNSRSAITDREGLVRFEGILEGSCEITVRKQRGVLPSVVRSVTSSMRHTICVPKSAMPEATLHGSVEVASGVALDDVEVELGLWSDGGNGTRQILHGAAFRFELLPAGVYGVSFRRRQDNALLALVRRVDVAAGATVDLGMIGLPPPTDVRIEVSCSDGGGVRAPFVGITTRDRVRIFGGPPQVAEGGGVLMQQFPAGSYELLVWGEDIAPVFVPVTTNGKAITVPIAAQRAVATTFRFAHGDGRLGSGTTTIRQQGAELLAERVRDPSSYVRGLLPGSYRIEFESPDGLRGAADFTVGDTAGPPIEVRLAK